MFGNGGEGIPVNSIESSNSKGAGWITSTTSNKNQFLTNYLL